jgi:Ca2+-binding EF-hand superfamily protein
MGQGTTRQEIEQLIEAVDEDESGELEFGEFLTVCARRYCIVVVLLSLAKFFPC